MRITAGTSEPIAIFVSDSSSSTGAGLGSLVYNTSSLVAEYRRKGQSSWTAFTLVNGTLGTFVDKGFIADGALSGAYELCPPANSTLAGVEWVAIRLYGATNMLPVQIRVFLDAINYQDGQRAGLTALPSSGTLLVKPAVTLATADVSGNLPANATQWNGTATTTDSVSLLPNVNAASAGISGLSQPVTGIGGSVPPDMTTPVPTSPIAGTLGEALFEVIQRFGRRNTAQGGTTSTITLDAGASSTDNLYKGYQIKITGGTGAGQFATIIGYVGSTKVATILRPTTAGTWTTTPDSTSTFIIDPAPLAFEAPVQSFNNTGQTTALPTTGNPGGGAFALVVKVTSDGTTAIVGATVRISGAQSALAITDGSGNAAVALNAGAVTVTATAPGYAGASAAQTVDGSGHWVSSGTGTEVVTLTAITIPSPTGPNQITGYLTTRDATGAAEASVGIKFQLIALPGTTDSFDSDVFTVTSDSNGLLVSEFVMGATYRGLTRAGKPVTFAAPSTGTTFELPRMLGSYSGNG